MQWLWNTPDGNVCQEMEMKDEHPDRKSGPPAVLT